MPAPAECSASVVICAYSDDRLDDIRAALTSVLAQTLPAFEIILVIDHNPVLLERLASEFPEVRVIPNAAGRGLSGARNTGLAAARGEIVAFLDDDAVAPPDWLARLLHHYQDPDVVAVGGGAAPNWPGERPQWLPREYDWVIGCTYKGQPTETAEVRNLIGCNMSAQRSAIVAVGGFNEHLGRSGNDAAGGEETELFIKIRQSNPGARIVYDPAIVVRHTIAADRTHWRYFRTRCLAEGRSKARLAAEVGSGDSLSAERSHVTRTLPLAVRDSLADTVLRGDPWGIVRAANVVAGLGFAAWGYATGRRRSAAAPAVPAFAPLRIVDLELGDRPAAIAADDPTTGARYGGAFCLVRRDGRAVGIVEVPSLPAVIGPDAFGDIVDPRDLPRIAAGREAPAASIVIATRDRPESLARCLDSLLAQDYPAFDIVVADSAPSSSATAQMIAERYRSTGRVRYARTERPGLGHAHNTGMALVSAPVAAFTDDDVIADRQWLAAIAGNFSGPGRVGCVTGLILPAELETRAQLWTERHGAFGKGFKRRVYDLEENRPAGPLFPYTAGQFGSGANMAFLTEALRRIGNFDAALGAGTKARGGDDLLAFHQVIVAGYQLVYEPQAIVWHFHRRQEEGMRRQAFGYGMGLGAYLTKAMMDDPAAAWRLARALPAGLRHMWGSSSERMQHLPADYPRDLVWRERLGVLAGPFGYVRSRLAARSWRAEPATDTAAAGLPESAAPSRNK